LRVGARGMVRVRVRGTVMLTVKRKVLETIPDISVMVTVSVH